MSNEQLHIQPLACLMGDKSSHWHPNVGIQPWDNASYGSQQEKQILCSKIMDLEKEKN